jgi:hypothetical protein
MNPEGRELFVGVLEDPASSTMKETKMKKEGTTFGGCKKFGVEEHHDTYH